MVGSNFFAKKTSTLDIAFCDANGLAVFAKCTGTPPTTANVFSHGCLINQTDSGTGTAAIYQNTGSSASPVWTLLDTALPGDSASKLIDTNSLTAVDVGTTASAVNNLRVTNSATGAVSANAVAITAVGSDSAVSLSMAPKGATGILTLGLSNGTGDIVVGSSSATQTTKIGNGAGIQNVNIANATVAGTTVTVAGAATGAGITDTVSISGGNAAATGVKVVNIATGTPGTSGNNRVTVGGGSTSAVTVNAVHTQYTGVNRTTGSAVANDPVATLTDASGNNVTVAAGLRILLTLASTLQAGANTLNLNGHGADSIKSHRNSATDIGTAYASTGIVDLLFNGTVWLDMSQ
jgi:hypothetical protein